MIDDPIANLRKWEAIIAALPPRESLMFHCGHEAMTRLTATAKTPDARNMGDPADWLYGLPIVVEHLWPNPRAWQVIAHLPGGDEIRYHGEVGP